MYALTFLVLLTFVTTLLLGPWSEVTDSWTVCNGGLSLVDILNIKLHFFQCSYLQNIKRVTGYSVEYHIGDIPV